MRVPHKTSDFCKVRSEAKFGSMDLSLSNYKSPHKTDIFSNKTSRAVIYNEDIHTKGPNGNKDASYSSYKRPIDACKFKEVCHTVLSKQTAKAALQAHENELSRISSNYDFSRKRENVMRTYGHKTVREIGSIAQVRTHYTPAKGSPTSRGQCKSSLLNVNPDLQSRGLEVFGNNRGLDNGPMPADGCKSARGSQRDPEHMPGPWGVIGNINHISGGRMNN